MKEWIDKLFEGFLPEDTLAKLRADYDRYQDVPLNQLGLDSMATMGLVIRLEERFGVEIDYESFDIGALETLEKIRGFAGLP